MNKLATAPGTEGYAEHADALAVQYERVTFADAHRSVLHLLPVAPGHVLDIGAGTGRDAAALAALGHEVVAVEPTAALRAHGQRLHPSAAITWIDDALPDLAVVTARDTTFDFILLSAVWMHLDTDQRRRAMPRIAGLLRPGGVMVLSLRHGLVPAGRRMFDVSADEVCASAHDSGLEMVHRSERPALLSGPDVRWSVLAFRTGDRSADQAATAGR